MTRRTVRMKDEALPLATDSEGYKHHLLGPKVADQDFDVSSCYDCYCSKFSIGFFNLLPLF